MVYTYNKNHEKSMVYIQTRGFYRILFSQILVQNKTNYISFESSPHTERNGTSHSFIPPTTAVKKRKAPTKNDVLCCISHWEGRMKLGIVPLKSV